jgi:transcriptional regulator with XRE-family HTH domain
LSHKRVAIANLLIYNAANSVEGGWMLKTTRLKELRERAALSQEDLARKSDVSRTTIARLEAGERPARPSTRRKLAEALGVLPEELTNSQAQA